MPTDPIGINAAAERTGISVRTLRSWAGRWPGLARRDALGAWIITDLDLLDQIAALHTAGHVTAEAIVTALSQLPESVNGLTLDQAAAELGVSIRTVRRWCVAVPGFGRHDEARRGWIISPVIAGCVAGVRDRNRRISPQRLAREIADIATAAALLRQTLRGGKLPPLLKAAIEARFRDLVGIGSSGRPRGRLQLFTKTN